MEKETITHEELVKVIDYNPETGSFTWKETNSNRRKIGQEAGTIAGNGRRYVNIHGKMYLGHRLAWFYMYRSWPENHVAPKNGDHLDLRIKNLIEQTPSQTTRKSKARVDNSSGYRGVTWDAKRKKWLAVMTVNYKLKHVGRFDTPEAAHEAYVKACAERVDAVNPMAEVQREKIRVRSLQRALWKRTLRDASGLTGWGSLDAFIESIGVPQPKLTLAPKDPLQMIGPENYVWVEPLTSKFDTSTREGRRAYEKERRKINPASFRGFELRRSFGLTLEQYQEMLLAQNGVCAICQKPETIARRGKVQPLAVDHCHDAGAIRDLLCERCNKGIGFFLEDPAALEAAALYLRKHVKRIAESGTNVIPIATGRRTNT